MKSTEAINILNTMNPEYLDPRIKGSIIKILEVINNINDKVFNSIINHIVNVSWNVLNVKRYCAEYKIGYKLEDDYKTNLEKRLINIIYNSL